MILKFTSNDGFCFQSLLRMAFAEVIAELETKAVAAEKLIQLPGSRKVRLIRFLLSLVLRFNL